MASIDPELTTVNELVERYPRCLPVLVDQGLDCCCGGALPVAEAARRHRVNVADLMKALEGALPEGGAAATPT